MGFAAPLMAIATIGSAAVGGVESYEAGQAQAAALEEQKKQVAAQTRSKQIQNLERVNQTLGNQMVVGAASGYDLSSTSFNAVSMDTMQKYEQDRDADALSASYQQSAIDICRAPAVSHRSANRKRTVTRYYGLSKWCFASR